MHDRTMFYDTVYLRPYMYVFSQAMYRGYWVRSRLCEVMQGARRVSNEENSLEEDVDLNLMDDVSTRFTYMNVQVYSFYTRQQGRVGKGNSMVGQPDAGSVV